MTRHLRRREWITAVAAGLASFGVSAANAPPEIRTLLPDATLSGSTRFRYWGFAVYDASLWVEPGFMARDYDRHGFALQLQYLRDFSNADITRRSIAEMSRQSNPTPERQQQWQQWLSAAFPDVRDGDRITGVHRPGAGALFLTNGRQTGMVPDADFARRFFGIWLDADTSEPALRQALLSQRAGP
jgi:hypothetical protein